MKRFPFSQLLKSASIDIFKEYERLYGLFYEQNFNKRLTGFATTIRDRCSRDFLNMPFRGTCVSLIDFDNSFGYDFKKTPTDFNVDYLISFCEYSYNLADSLAIYCENSRGNMAAVLNREPLGQYVQQVRAVVDKIGYMPVVRDGVTDFVPKDQAAISVAEIIDPSLSYKVIEYNHHSMKGDLERKRAVLLALADRLEPQRAKLKQINNSLEDDLFFLLNNVNIRHNNLEQGGKKFIPFVATLGENQIEQWYDETYQMCLLAFLELDHLERKDRIKHLKVNVSSK